MTNKTTYLENLILKGIYSHGGALAAVLSGYLALVKTGIDNAEAGSFTEVESSAVNGYARIACNTVFPADVSASGVMKNSSPFGWTCTNANGWPSSVGIIVYDSATIGAGNALTYIAIGSVNVANQQTITVPINGWTHTER